MALVLLTVYLVAWGGGCGAALVLLVYQMSLFMQSVNPNAASETAYVCAALVCALPVAALIAGYLLDEFLLRSVRGESIRLLVLPLAAALFLGSGLFLDYAEAGVTVLSEGGAVRYALYFSAITSAVIFCGGITAMCAMGMCVVLELPLRWLASAGAPPFVLSYEGIRIVAVLLVLALSANLILGMFARELLPTVILRMVGG